MLLMNCWHLECPLSTSVKIGMVQYSGERPEVIDTRSSQSFFVPLIAAKATLARAL